MTINEDAPNDSPVARDTHIVIVDDQDECDGDDDDDDDEVFHWTIPSPSLLKRTSTLRPTPNYTKKRRATFMLQIPSNLSERDLDECNLKICKDKFELGDNVFVDRPFNITQPSVRLALWNRSNSACGTVMAPSSIYYMNFDRSMICILKDSIQEMLLAINSAHNHSFGGYVLNIGRMKP